MNILKKADKLINSNEGGRIKMYGSIQDNFKDAAIIASVMLKKEVTPKDLFMGQMALKLARESYKHKEDNLIDLVGYTAALNDYLEEN